MKWGRRRLAVPKRIRHCTSWWRYPRVFCSVEEIELLPQPANMHGKSVTTVWNADVAEWVSMWPWIRWTCYRAVSIWVQIRSITFLLRTSTIDVRESQSNCPRLWKIWDKVRIRVVHTDTGHLGGACHVVLCSGQLMWFSIVAQIKKKILNDVEILLLVLVKNHQCVKPSRILTVYSSLWIVLTNR